MGGVRGKDVHYAKDTASSEARGWLPYAAAGGHGLGSEKIGALIWTGAYERDVRFP